MREKQKNKMGLFLIMLVLLGMAFGSCEKDLYDDGLHQEAKEIKKISFTEFKRNSGAYTKLKTVKKEKPLNSLAKYVYDETYELYIDTDNITLMTKDDLKYYTIPIKIDEDVYMKNLLLAEKADGTYKASIVGYKLTSEEIERMRAQLTVDISDKTYIKEYMEQTGRFSEYVKLQNNTMVFCGYETHILLMCASGQHTYGDIDCQIGTSQPPRIVIKVVKLFCPADDNSPGSGPSGGGDGTTTGGSPVNPPPNPPTDPDQGLTTPVVPALDGPPKNPCSELNKFTTNNTIQQTLRILKQQSAGTAEHGNYINEETNSVGATYLAFPVIPPKPNNPNELDILAGLTAGNIKGAMHCHTDPGSTRMFPMLSAGDFGALYGIAYSHLPANDAQKDYAEYTVILSVGSGHYALKFKNFSGDYYTFNHNIVSFTKNLEDDNKLLGPTAPSSDLIKVFLNRMNQYFSNEVGLYKATEGLNSNGQPIVTGWKEQTLNSQGDIEPIPCP